MSLENGLILAYDSRTLPTSRSKKSGLSSAQPKYTLSAHDGAASAFDVNPHIRGCLVTGGMDKMVKIWNIQDDETEGVVGRKREISLATSRDLGLVCPHALIMYAKRSLRMSLGQDFRRALLARSGDTADTRCGG